MSLSNGHERQTIPFALNPHAGGLIRAALGSAVILAVATVLAAGCSLRPLPPTTQQVEIPLTQEFVRKAPENDGEVRDEWVKQFDDKTLEALVREALAKNLDLKIAATQVQLSRVRTRRAAAALYPNLDFFAGAGRGTSNAAYGTIYGPGGNNAGSVNNFDFGLSGSWEADVWGRIRDEVKASQFDFKVQVADYEFAKQSIAAQVADGWILAIAADQQIKVDQETLETEKWTENIVNAKSDLGTASKMDLDVAHANTVTAESALMASRSAREDAIRSLEVLLARYPKAELEVSHQFPAMPPAPPVGLPSQLLERRPDLIAADRTVAAAFYRVESAKAAKLPRIALNTTVGYASDALHDLVDPANLAWNIGANLTAPILDGGLRNADIQINKLQKQEALLNYTRTAIRAFFDVETALNAEAVLRDREHKMADAVDHLSHAQDAAKLRYGDNDMTLLQLNQIQNQFFSAEGELVRLRSERLRSRIRLYLALGGSFLNDPTTQPDTQPDTQPATDPATTTPSN